jgi:hypothetical protein
MHYTLILSPKGQYLLKLVDNANKLVPYMVLRQTLKIGNVATMINAMVKVGLAKMSVASVTNWMGLTKDQDEGNNLMQTCVSSFKPYFCTTDLDVATGSSPPSSVGTSKTSSYEAPDSNENARNSAKTNSPS